MNDLHWRTQHKGQVFDPGQPLAVALGYTPNYLCYNTGLRIPTNAHEFAVQLKQLAG